MNIGIDMRMLGSSGIGVFIEKIATELINSGNNKYQYFLYGEPDKLKKLPAREGVHKISFQAPLYGLKEQFLLNKRFLGEPLDLLHSPHYTVPVLYGGKMVVTVHDLIHLLFPQYLPNKLAFHYAKYMIGTAVVKAKKVITVSENTKRDLMEWFGLPEEKITIVYNAVDREIFRPVEDPQKVAALKNRFGIKKPYVLYVGNIKPHKNVAGLLQAFAIVREKSKGELNLVMAGKRFAAYTDLDNLVKKLRLQEDLIFTGSLETSDLPILYSGAEVFVFPSFYEGFGIPPLEAMACGTPVITSNTSSLPEVVGEAALMVDPRRTEELAGEMLRVLHTSSLRQALREKGLARVREFSWAESAERTLGVYREVLGS